MGVCRASASGGCLMGAEDPADPETSVWKLENVTQKEAWRRFLWAAAQLCCCPWHSRPGARRELGRATSLRTPAVLEGEGGNSALHTNSGPPASREKAGGGSASFSPTCLQREPWP